MSWKKIAHNFVALAFLVVIAILPQKIILWQAETATLVTRDNELLIYALVENNNDGPYLQSLKAKNASLQGEAQKRYSEIKNNSWLRNTVTAPIVFFKNMANISTGREIEDILIERCELIAQGR